MTQNVEDLRVRRTRKLIQKALLEATSEKGFANVTVRDIAERAMINRATFYRHYADKYDLLRHYIAELAGLIDAPGAGSSPGLTSDPAVASASDGLVSLLRHLQANADFYRMMLGKQGDAAFCAQSFRPFVEQGFSHMLASQTGRANDPTRPPVELLVTYVIHAGVGAIVWWLEDGQAFSPEQIAIWLRQLSVAAIDMALMGAESQSGAKSSLSARPSIRGDTLHSVD